MDSSLTISDVLWRVLAATIAGGLVGAERESHGRPAGLRTAMLACVAAAMAMIISEDLYTSSAVTSGTSGWRPDPARLGAGILTGIGFLGAGTILRHANLVRGVTTAASLWFVTVIGLAFGGGLFVLGSIGVGIALLTLLLLRPLEKCLPTDWYATITVSMELDAMADQELERRLVGVGVKLTRMQFDYDLARRQKTIICEVKVERHSSRDISSRMVADLRQCPGILNVRWT